MKKIITRYLKQVSLGACLLLLSVTTFSQSGAWVDYDGEDAIFRILKDGKNLWIAANAGLSQLNTETDAVTFHELGLSDLPRVRNLAKDNDGNLWITTQRNGVIKYAGQHSREHYNTSNSALATDQYCTSIAVAADNSKGIGSLLYLNKFDGNTWQQWTTPQSAIAAYWFISDLKFDRNGDLWIGGDAPEWHLAKFTGDSIQPVPEITKAVCEILIDDDNNKWLASLNGLIKYDGVQFTTWNTGNSNLPANDIYDIKQDVSGNIWLACSQHLVRFDGREFAVYPSPLVEKNNPLDVILCLESDDEGNIWAGTKLSGLFQFTPAQEVFRPVSVALTAIKTVAGKNANEGFLVRTADSELSVHLSLAADARVSLTVSDLQGREVVALLKERRLSKGNHRYAASLPEGIYVVGYTANGKTVAEKVLVK